MPIKIISKKDGFRRAGLAHSGTVIYPDEYFTGEQLEALGNEPNLDVSATDGAPTVGGPGKTFKRLADALGYIAETGDAGPHIVDADGGDEPEDKPKAEPKGKGGKK